MTAGTSLKICLVILTSALVLAVGPAAAQTGAAISSRSFRGNRNLCRTIQGLPLARSPIRSPHLAPGSLRRISASAVLTRTSVRQRMLPRGGRDLMAPRSLRGPLVRVPRSTWLSSKFSPRVKQSVPHNLPDQIVAEARHYLGTPYRLGGSLETGRSTDCSGLVQFVYHNSNIELPRSSSEQVREGKAVAYSLDFSKLCPGDLLFFGPRRRHVNHVGIYAGGGKMIHASRSSGRVVVSDLSESYLERSFMVAKRLPEVQSPK